jgi:hypothetical protein
MDTNPAAAQGGHSFSYKAAWKVSRKTTLKNSWDNRGGFLGFVASENAARLKQIDLAERGLSQQSSTTRGRFCIDEKETVIGFIRFHPPRTQTSGKTYLQARRSSHAMDTWRN